MATVTMTVKDRVKALLDEYKAKGKKAPSVREAAKRLGVSSGSVSTAMKEIREGVERSLPLGEIVLDDRCQLRVGQDPETVSSYARAMEDGIEFPPVVVYYDGTSHFLADGFHRYAGANLAKKKVITALVREGTLDDAILYAAGANTRNGLRVTNADKRKAVLTILKHPVHGKLSFRKIAELCGVSHPFVSRLKDELEGKDQPAPEAKVEPEMVTVTSPDEPVPEPSEPEAAKPKAEKPAVKESVVESEPTFEEWVEAMPARAELTGDAVTAFDREARIYWVVSQSQAFRQVKAHAEAILDADVTPSEYGPITRVLRQVANLPHPRTYEVCEGCSGSGRSANGGVCTACLGNGFTG